MWSINLESHGLYLLWLATLQCNIYYVLLAECSFWYLSPKLETCSFLIQILYHNGSVKREKVCSVSRPYWFWLLINRKLNVLSVLLYSIVMNRSYRYFICDTVFKTHKHYESDGFYKVCCNWWCNITASEHISTIPPMKICANNSKVQILMWIQRAYLHYQSFCDQSLVIKSLIKELQSYCDLWKSLVVNFYVQSILLSQKLC